VIVVSVASGTSVDALDVGVVDLAVPDGSGTVEVEVLAGTSEPWPHDLRSRLLALLPPASTTAAELCALDTAVGQAVGAVAAEAADRVGGADLVVSPGQTVHHEVDGDRCLGTLQVGQPAWVAEATGLPVVSDLRTRDVAAGGHGAPLAGILDSLWLAGGPGPRVALNLGGIANVSVVQPDGSSLAWDTGPANCLLDVAAGRASGGAHGHDVDGAMAARGRVLPELLDRLLAHPYFALTPPVSTGRETFSAGYLDHVVGPDPVWDDVAATLVELTARTVADALAPYDVTEVVASGGGVRNPSLMAALARHLPVPVRSSDELGLPADGKESVLWALLGFLSWHGVPVTTDPASGRPPRVLGRITPGAQPLVLPPPLRPPTRLRVRTPDHDLATEARSA
jgi:anhydro-N-acetylmuramic acid kinase